MEVEKDIVCNATDLWVSTALLRGKEGGGAAGSSVRGGGGASPAAQPGCTTEKEFPRKTASALWVK